MKYFDFLFGLLSYTTGIGATTLLILHYLRYNKTLIVRELIFFNLCFTLHFILEMLRPLNYSSALYKSLILSGSFFTNIGIGYFVGAYFYGFYIGKLTKNLRPYFGVGLHLAAGS